MYFEENLSITLSGKIANMYVEEFVHMLLTRLAEQEIITTVWLTSKRGCVHSEIEEYNVSNKGCVQLST